MVADHPVLADDEPVRRLFLHPVLAIVFAVHHVAALPGLRRRRRGATGGGGATGRGRDGGGGGAGGSGGGAGGDIGGGGTPRGRRGRHHQVLLHAVYAAVTQHADRLVYFVILFRFRVHPFRFHVQPLRFSVVRFRQTLLQRGRR